jgi:hypothetical protein
MCKNNETEGTMKNKYVCRRKAEDDIKQKKKELTIQRRKSQ